MGASGYVGYEEGGYLTEAVRRKPYSVLLLDEVEKAHPDVFNILLQVLEDGRLTDGQGRTVDFRNTVIVMTSNMGSDIIQRMGGDDNDYELMKNAVMEVVGNHFRPELINRIDEVVVFHALGQEQIQAIAGIQLERLKGRLAEHDLSLEISDDAMAQLAVVGFANLGRGHSSAIQSRIENPLAQDLLAGKYVPGDTIHISADEGSQCLVNRAGAIHALVPLTSSRNEQGKCPLRRWRGIFLRLLRPLLRLKGSKVDRLRALMESLGS